MKAKLIINIEYSPSTCILDKDTTQNIIDLMLCDAAVLLQENGRLSGDFETESITHEVEFIEKNTPSPTVHIVAYSHPHGTDVTAYATPDGALASARQIMKENIQEVVDPDELDLDGDNEITFINVQPHEWGELTGNKEFLDIHTSQILDEVTK